MFRAQAVIGTALAQRFRGLSSLDLTLLPFLVHFQPRSNPEELLTKATFGAENFISVRPEDQFNGKESRNCRIARQGENDQ